MWVERWTEFLQETLSLKLLYWLRILQNNNITYFSKYCIMYTFWKPVKTTYAISRSFFFTRVCMSGMESDFDSGDFLLIRSMCNFFSGVSFLGGPVRLVQSTNNLRNQQKIIHFLHFSRNNLFLAYLRVYYDKT